MIKYYNQISVRYYEAHYSANVCLSNQSNTHKKRSNHLHWRWSPTACTGDRLECKTSWCYLMSLNTHAPLLPEDTTCRLQLQSHNSFVYELSPISLKSRTDPPCLVCASARASIPVRDSTFSRYWPLSLHLFDPLANHTLWLLCSKMAASSAPHHTSSHLKSKYDHLPVV